MAADDFTEAMTIEKLSSYLKVPKSTLYKLVQEGRVPRQKVGKHWRFGKSAVDRWINDEQDREK